MKLCPRCNQYFTDTVEQCPTDGSSLENAGEDPMVGALINNRYLIDSVIGNGSSGTVYRANRLGRGEMVVAIKVLHSYIGAAGPALDRFLREAQAASRLRNPHIITIWETGVTEDGQPYFVMDYLEGITLGRLIRDKGYLEPKRVLSIVRQICDALGEAHRQDIIHRDLKPENVILQESDHGHDYVKLLDFGIADSPQHSQSSFKLEKPKTVSGSPAYMSPEQCQGLELDKRSDIYSLGIVVFEMLSGRRPFSQQENINIMLSHVNEIPRKLSTARSDLEFSSQIDDVIARALSKQPEDRQATVQDFFVELEQALENNCSKEASPVGSLKQAVKAISTNTVSFVNVWGSDTCHDIETPSTHNTVSLSLLPIISEAQASSVINQESIDIAGSPPSNSGNGVIERLFEAAQQVKEMQPQTEIDNSPPLEDSVKQVVENLSLANSAITRSDLEAVVSPQESYYPFEIQPLDEMSFQDKSPENKPPENEPNEVQLDEAKPYEAKLHEAQLHETKLANSIRPMENRAIDARTQGWGKVEREPLLQATTGLRAAARKSENVRPPLNTRHVLFVILFLIILLFCLYTTYAALTPRIPSVEEPVPQVVKPNSL